jgi:hypothetical protein
MRNKILPARGAKGATAEEDESDERATGNERKCHEGSWERNPPSLD